MPRFVWRIQAPCKYRDNTVEQTTLKHLLRGVEVSGASAATERWQGVPWLAAPTRTRRMPGEPEGATAAGRAPSGTLEVQEGLSWATVLLGLFGPAQACVIPLGLLAARLILYVVQTTERRWYSANIWCARVCVRNGLTSEHVQRREPIETTSAKTRALHASKRFVAVTVRQGQVP